MLVLTLGCETKPEKKGVEGLWLVEKVQAGENSMTPVARWIKLESDSTQTSGNGWLQHSYGSWSLKKDSLKIIDENGIKDEYGNFKLTLDGNSMTWTRIEEGQKVTVFLKRAEAIPTSEGNQLLGLWKLTKSIDKGNDITIIVNPDGKSMIHLRWDNMYVQHNMPKGKSYGIYRIHAHKPEIQLVNYGQDSKFSFWSFSIDNKKLKLTSTDKKSEMEFERIHQFLQ